MSRRRRRAAQKRNWWVPLLVIGNVLVLGGAAMLLWNRLAAPPAQAPAPVAVAPKAQSQIDWSDRWAADADGDPICQDCNVIMVALDIFRPDHLACLGYGADPAPNMCTMIQEGLLFDNFIVHAYQTPIAQMSNFTGKYPSKSGFVSFASTLDPAVATMPERFQAAGYTTVAMGSSFEVMTDMSNSASTRRKFTRQGLNPALSFGRGFDRFIFTGNRNIPTDAIPWVREHKDEKFFLWMILGTLHWPYGARGEPADQEKFDPPGYQGILKERLPLGFQLLSHIYDGRLYETPGGPSVALGRDDAAFVNARYDFGLWTVDQFVGSLLDAIPPETLKKTVVVLYGVHGEDLGEHGYFGHYDVFDTEVKMSFVVLNPKHRAQGVRISEQVEGVDFAPTMLELVGLPPMEDIDGQSFVPAMRAGKGDPERLAFFERIPLWEDIFRHKSGMPQGFVDRVSGVLDSGIVGDRGVRTTEWKLIHRTARETEAQVSWLAHLSGRPMLRPEWELYDLVNDPTEQTNVADAHPAVLERLQAPLLAWEATLMPPQKHTPPPEAPAQPPN